MVNDQIADADRARAADFVERFTQAALPVYELIKEIMASGYQCNFQIGVKPDGTPDLRCDIFKSVKITP